MIKENQSTNFNRILKKLEMDNVSLPELRSLKQEHVYLQKLKQQRIKIQDLKERYDHSQISIKKLQDQNRKQKMHIESQQRDISRFKELLQQQQEKKKNAEKVINKSQEQEREQIFKKYEKMTQQIEEMAKQLKEKELYIYQLEDRQENNNKIFKQRLQHQRKKMQSDFEIKYKLQSKEAQQYQHQIQQLKTLIDRQDSALKEQSQNCKQLIQKLEVVEREIQDYEVQSYNWKRDKAESSEKILELNNQIQFLNQELQSYQDNQNAKGQLQQLRKRMAEQTKGQIQRIQYIVNQFD